MELVAYIGIALLAGGAGGYVLAASGFRLRLPIKRNNTD